MKKKIKNPNNPNFTEKQLKRILMVSDEEIEAAEGQLEAVDPNIKVLVVTIDKESYNKLEAMRKHSGATLSTYIQYIIGYRYADWIKQDSEWSD